MSTEAQTAANKANAQHSTGPKTTAGKAASSMNAVRHGLTGEFYILGIEDPSQYDLLVSSFRYEYKPATFTEEILVEKMAQHQFLRDRAIMFQTFVIADRAKPECENERSLATYLRYETAHERAFHKCLNDLLKLRAEKRKTEIGFESQERKRNQEARAQAEATRKEAAQVIRQNTENRRQELHKFDVWLAEAKAEHQEQLNARLETPETRIPNRLERILARQQAA